MSVIRGICEPTKSKGLLGERPIASSRAFSASLLACASAWRAPSPLAQPHPRVPLVGPFSDLLLPESVNLNEAPSSGIY